MDPDRQLLVTLSVLALAILIGWRFDWRPAIQSRRWAVGLALLAGLLVTPASMMLMALSAMAAAHRSMGLDPGGPLPGWWPLYWGLGPVAVVIGLVAFASARRHRLAVVGAGVAALIGGYALLFGWTEWDQRVSMVSPVIYVNQTDRPISIRHEKDGDGRLTQDYPRFEPGETYQNPIGYRIAGRWIRVVAQWPDGSVAFDRTYTWDELRRAGGRIVIAPPAP